MICTQRTILYPFHCLIITQWMILSSFHYLLSVWWSNSLYFSSPSGDRNSTCLILIPLPDLHLMISFLFHSFTHCWSFMNEWSHSHLLSHPHVMILTQRIMSLSFHCLICCTLDNHYTTNDTILMSLLHPHLMILCSAILTPQSRLHLMIITQQRISCSFYSIRPNISQSHLNTTAMGTEAPVWEGWH